jgi:hypothetical protein
MLTVVILIVLAAAGLLLVLLAVVVVAIHQESRDVEMRTVAPSLVAVVVRRMLGVYLRRPAPPVDSTEEWPSDTWTSGRPPCRRR